MKKFKQDKYRRMRGGKAMMLQIFCANCGTKIMEYQKDGEGYLHRCYLNRIIAPPHLQVLQNDPTIHEIKDLPALICNSCNTVIGSPMRYIDGRLAYRMRPGLFSKKKG